MNFTADLTNCDREPIHIPGQVQSHGFLIAIDSDYIIRFHSENVYQYLKGLPQSLLDLPISHIQPIIGENEPPDFIEQLINFGRGNKSFDQTNPFNTDIQGTRFYLIISTAGPFYLLEFEPVNSDLKTDLQRMVGSSLTQMLSDKNLQNLLQNSAGQVKQIIGYDRVMIYQFAEDGHGIVVAEAKNDHLTSWMGLHYPASDIPKQARELYKLNYTRIIADVHSETSKIVTTQPYADAPLDLTFSQLRAVSPIHIQYLKNMEVDSSFSISLMYKNELWGLIACHNYSPRFIDYRSRESAKLIGQILSSALEFRQDEASQHLADQFNSNVDLLAKQMQKSTSVEDALTRQSITILNAVEAAGAVLVYEDSIIKLGQTPDDKYLPGLISWIKTNINESFYYTHQLPKIYPEAANFKKVASGMMVLTLSEEMSEYIIWFKPEHVETITWAGNPDKPVEMQDGVMKISPRHSFEAYTQQIANQSDAWTPEEIKSAARLKTEVIYAINQKAGAIRMLNERLKQAYEELDTFSFTISHDLKNPLSTIKGYSQMLTRDKSLEPKMQDILTKITGKVDKMNAMINEVLEYSRIGRLQLKPVEVDVATIVHEHIRDLKMIYDAEHIEVEIGEIPSVQGDPLMISQVFANLLSNAIKYSLPSKSPRVRIEGKEIDGQLVYTVKDNGVGIDIKQLPMVFELFKRMDNVQDIEGSGVGLAIVKRIVEKHQGKIWVDSELGKGSTFFVAFNQN